MTKLKTITLDGVDYVRKDQIKSTAPDELDGLKYAVVRSRNQGVMSGYVVDISGQVVTLKRARQLWKWNSKFTLVELAESGVNLSDNCKFSEESSQEVIMLEACGVIYCSETGGQSIRSQKAYSNE